MKIDAHQHFWNYDPRQYAWITDAFKRLRRDFLPGDLAREWAKVPFEGSVAVEARQTLEETRWLLLLADHCPFIKGVVGWVDLRLDQVADQLLEFSEHRRFVGVRHVVQDEPDDKFMLRPDFMRGLGRLKQFNLTYDLLLYPKHLPAALKVVERLIDQRFVLDHIAKPLIKDGITSPWKEHIKDLAVFQNVYCKVSGLVTEANWGQWKAENFRPYLDVVFDAFGPDRLMFGSDWPVCLLSGSYEQVFGLVHDYIQQFPESTQLKIMGNNAVKFYGLRP